MKKICKNCRLFNDVDNVCSVAVVINGENFELPVRPGDKCHWEKIDEDIEQELKNAIATAPTPALREQLKEELDKHIEIRQIRIWSDGKDGFIEHS